MSWLVVDQRATKAEAIDLLESLGSNADEDMNAHCLALLRPISRNWNVSHERFMALAKSQILSGNKKSIVKVIEGSVPDYRFKIIPAIIVGIIAWPFRFVWSIISLGFGK